MSSNGGANDTRSRAVPEPLQVVIVGAGIAGLSAAIFLREQGHKITVLERSRFANEVGAALHIAPNSHGLLKRIGIYAHHINGTLMRSVTEYDMSNTLKRDVDLTENNKLWQHEWSLIHRVHLHEELKRRATSTEYHGYPVELRTACPVIEVDPASATATLEGGELVRGDVLLGADGVKSVTRSKLVGGDIKPKPSGKNAFRFLVPRQTALDDPVTRDFATRDGQLIIWQLNFVCIHPREESQSAEIAEGEWNLSVRKDRLLEVYKDFHPSIVALLNKADADSLKVWELLDMDALPTWVEDRLALLGDAAHPFLPRKLTTQADQGQGGACAIEDAASLGVVLQRGVRYENIPERLRLYQDIRMERAHQVQEYSRIAGLDLGKRKLDMMGYTNYNFGHDEWDYSINAFRSGREELGMPKLYCSLDLWRRETSYRIQAGWQGATFGTFLLDGLKEVDPSEDKGTIGGEDDQGIIAYKYIPRVGDRGAPDVEHATIPKDIRPISRFITTHDVEAKTTFSDTLSEEAPFQTLPDGVDFALCYATNKFPVSFSADSDISTYQHYTQNLPGITIAIGTVLRVVDMPPGALSPMHRTVSFDYYGVVLDGGQLC
ncbi:hypothetical protein SAPIO_CDS4752 [Scedosporium apiospermum]|uniref:FAD-binding domain-containing protein n=1 Tax=Pseudallescheria apiosperma TaxID=563466 RepID=A0A084G7J6_PSEDA|nr:uncharacterized protein SAPIO_CDS4752 [Scedosporium apiospermum]KEZ43308.1 hypothetical protein SAPIO_CDS4752 [Scedosporium apiospermum]